MFVRAKVRTLSTENALISMIESGYFRSDAKYQSCEAQRSFFWPRTTISITIPTYGTYIVEIELLDPRFI